MYLYPFYIRENGIGFFIEIIRYWLWSDTNLWWLACQHNPAVKPMGYDMIKIFGGKKGVSIEKQKYNNNKTNKVPKLRPSSRTRNAPCMNACS